MNEHRFSAPGGPVTLAYELDAGAPGAPAVVYCHGLFSGRNGQRATTLRAWCRKVDWWLLRFDFRGRGDSSGSIRELTLTRHLEDLDAILGVLPAGVRPILFGSSLGGLAAAWFAALHPDRVAACALVAPAFSIVDNLLLEAGPDRAARWRRERVLRLEKDDTAFELDYGIVEDAGHYPEPLLHSAYRTPTLVAHGMADAVVPYARSVAFAEGVRPGLVDLHLFAGGDHRLHGFMDEILALLAAFARRRLPPAD